MLKAQPEVQLHLKPGPFFQHGMKAGAKALRKGRIREGCVFSFASSGTARMLVKLFLKDANTLLALQRREGVTHSNAALATPKTLHPKISCGLFAV